MDFLLNPAFSIYVTLAVVLAVWLGIFALLWRLDRQARELKRRLDTEPQTPAAPAPRATLEVRKGHPPERVTHEEYKEPTVADN
ncbi:MAG TPA: CcmD family protein [Roseiflexaceae bacterium]|jgi:CcmD family protein|nr:CcmD family protein [Roseiflexaceae bacterium]